MASDDIFLHYTVQEDNTCGQYRKSRSPSDSPGRFSKSTKTSKINNCSKCSSQCGSVQPNYSNDFHDNASRRAISESSNSISSEQNNCGSSQNYYYEDFHTDSSETSTSNSGSSCIVPLQQQSESKGQNLPEEKNENNLQAKGGKTLPKKKQQQKTTFATDHIINSQKNNNIARRLLSARAHKIKELKNEVAVLQNKLEASNMENQILKRLQYRHLKAISKYENAETNLPDLLAKQCGEVQTLRALLRKSQEQERNASRKLREVETQLLKTKDTLQALQKLSEDKNLAERGELKRRLTTLAQRMEAGDKRIQGLEKQLLLNNTSFSHQLAVEKKKTIEARSITTNLQMEIKLLNQKIKEKERELGIRNIYAYRMLKGQPEKGDSHSSPKDVNVSKSIQVNISLEATTLRKPEPERRAVTFKEELRSNIGADLCEVHKKIEQETEVHLIEKLPVQEISNRTCTELQKEEICPRVEKSIKYENVERQKNRRKGQGLDLLKEEFEKLRTEPSFLSAHHVQPKENNLEEAAAEKQENEENKESKEAVCDKLTTVNQRYKTPSKFKKQYVFTEAIENLHQGYPSTGPLSNTNVTCSSRQRNQHQGEIAEFKTEDSISTYEPSFGKVPKARQKDTPSTHGEDYIPNIPMEKKNTLMEELFGPSCILNNSHPNSNLNMEGKEKKTLQSKKPYDEISCTNDGLQCGDSNQAHINVFQKIVFLDNLN
ncbi:lebercilin-like protein [Liasis olivaceus]